MIGVLHAYGRQNAGDGLLVDLTLERLERAGVDRDQTMVVALDPSSFPELPRTVGCGTDVRRPSAAAARAAASAVSSIRSSRRRTATDELDEAIRACDALVAVGGGYLRTPDVVSSIGTAVNHLPQLELAARTPVPSMYLPQSIGPLSGPVGRRVRGLLADITEVCVRDEVSASELAHLDNVRLVPDLALLQLAERGTPTEPRRGDTTIIVGRAVGEAPDLALRLQRLADLLTGHRWAVQAAGDRSKSDGHWYAANGIADDGPLSQVIADARCDVVVSVRLHGAIMALLAGVPAIHLAYDRKGPAAFADLGIPDLCFDVEHFDPEDVAEQVRRIRADPDDFWQRIAAPLDRLRAQSSDLDGRLRALLRS